MSFDFKCLLASSILMSSVSMADNHNFYSQFNVGAAFAPSSSQSFLVAQIGNVNTGTITNIYEKITHSYDAGFIGSMAVGYRIADPFRIELEGLYQSNNLDKESFSFSGTVLGQTLKPPPTVHLNGDRERTAFLFSGYYDFKNSSPFTPFITAGLGGYHLRLKTASSDSANDLDFAWQAGAGINYMLNNQFSFDLKYRYLGGTDAKLQDQLYSVGDHQLITGIRIYF